MEVTGSPIFSTICCIMLQSHISFPTEQFWLEYSLCSLWLLFDCLLLKIQTDWIYVIDTIIVDDSKNYYHIYIQLGD